jgi:hypothetical protein
MRPRTLPFAAALVFVAVIAGCSKVTQENFGRIDQGMQERDVLSLLGSPTESSSVDVLGVSGTTSRWVGRDAEITIRFVNGKVATKAFDKPAAAK